MDWISIATFITAIGTICLAGATFYYAYTSRKLMITQEKELQRPRKKDEVESIITPIIEQCNNEIKNINENRVLIITKFDGFYDGFSKNHFKKMIYEDFILNHLSLSKMISTHDKLTYKIKEHDEAISKKFNEDKYQSKIRDMLRNFNNEVKTGYSEDSLPSLSKSLLINIIEGTDHTILLGGPEKIFWEKYEKELLILREQDFKIYLEKLNTLGKQLTKIDNNIIGYLKKICNEYTKEYGISLDAELKSPFY